MKYQAVIFDLDETLYSFKACDKKAMAAMSAYAQNMFGRPAEDFISAYAAADKQIKAELAPTAACHNRMIIFQRMLDNLGYPSIGTTLDFYNVFWDTFLDNIQLFDGAEQLLKGLKDNGIKCGICTDMTAHIQHRKLIKLNIVKYFDCFTASEEAGADKPNPRIFNLCLEKLGVSADKTAYIGDAFHRDVEGAHNVGIYPFWLNMRYKEAPKADFDFTEIHDLNCLDMLIK